MNRVHVIVNPFSAHGRTGQRWNLIREAISQAFREFKYIFTEKPRQATALARNPKVSILKAKRIRIEAKDPVAVECDGELCGALPAEFEILPRRLNFRI